MTAPYISSLPAQTAETANDAQKAVLAKALAQVGFIPNMYARMVNVPGLLDMYLDGYASFRSASGFTAQEQEVVFLTISRENGCDYCVAAHSFIADVKSKVPVDVTDAIRNRKDILDPRLAALSTFTLEMVETRGRPSAKAANEFLAAGFTESHILQIVLALAVKTLSNYSNHIFNTPLDEVFAARKWEDTGR